MYPINRGKREGGRRAGGEERREREGEGDREIFIDYCQQYDCDFEDLYGAITNFYKYNLPVWVTEFSCYGASVQDGVTFVDGILPLFDTSATISR
jgi:hypothetical protein